MERILFAEKDDALDFIVDYGLNNHSLTIGVSLPGIIYLDIVRREIFKMFESNICKIEILNTNQIGLNNRSTFIFFTGRQPHNIRGIHLDVLCVLYNKLSNESKQILMPTLYNNKKSILIEWFDKR